MSSTPRPAEQPFTTQPTQPSAPGNPGPHEAPGQPTQPQAPGNPGPAPEHSPGQPTQPQAPGNPGPNEAPGQPTQPQAPGNPGPADQPGYTQSAAPSGAAAGYPGQSYQPYQPGAGEPQPGGPLGQPMPAGDAGPPYLGASGQALPPVGPDGQPMPPGGYPPAGGAWVAPSAPQKKKASKLARILSAVAAAALVITFSLLWRSGIFDTSMKVGDCVRQVGEDNIEVVACDSGQAQYKILGIKERQSQMGAQLGACQDWPDATTSYWTGRRTGNGTLYCMARV